jgi:CBS domain-containing protein
MAVQKIGCLPVVEGDALVGMLTETDILHLVAGVPPGPRVGPEGVPMIRRSMPRSSWRQVGSCAPPKGAARITDHWQGDLIPFLIRFRLSGRQRLAGIGPLETPDPDPDSSERG